MTESNSCLKDQMFILRKENQALKESISTLEDKLVDIQEQKDEYEAQCDQMGKELTKMDKQILEFDGKIIIYLTIYHHIALKSAHKAVNNANSCLEDKIYDQNTHISTLISELQGAKIMIQKYSKQIENNQDQIRCLESAHDTVLQQVKDRCKTDIQKVKEAFEKQQEVVYAVQEIKLRTSDVSQKCNGCDAEIQTDDKPAISVAIGSDVELTPIELNASKPPIGANSGLTTPISVQIGSDILTTQEPENKISDVKWWSVATNWDLTTNDAKDELMLHKVSQVKQKYRNIKSEYLKQWENLKFESQLKSKYHKLYKECHQILKSVLTK